MSLFVQSCKIEFQLALTSLHPRADVMQREAEAAELRRQPRALFYLRRCRAPLG